ncbi:MAG: hypothetical protein M0Z28_11330 [Rhodospirillales bacterium]|nr:hypothetical protein [Rhodospirillales bacterium]
MKPAALTVLLLLGTGSAIAAPPVRDPDWPCQQIKVADLSIGALWNGPDLTAAMQHWSQDAEVASLAQRVAERRMPLDQAEAAIKDFAHAAGGARREKLLALAAGVFQTMNAERGQVVAGLDRFGKRQKQLAADIHADMDKLRAQQPDAGSNTAAQAGPLSGRLGWETRLFEQRRQEIAAACDVPNRIEQRLYALEQTIQGLLS